MSQGAPDIGSVDAVQIFDVGKALGELRGATELASFLGMATSPNCDIVVHQARPGQALQFEPKSDSDQIVFVLQGSCRVEESTGQQLLEQHQGILVAAGATVRCINTSESDLVLLTLRTGAGSERPGYVPNQPSGVMIRVPADQISARGIGRHLYVFAMSQRTIGVGVNFTEEWNLGSFLRMNCQFVRDGDDILVNLPERMARWYRVRNLTEADYRIIPDPERWRVRVDLTPLIQREAGSAAS